MSILEYLENLYDTILRFFGDHEKLLFLISGAIVLMVAMHQMFLLYVNESYNGAVMTRNQ